MAAAGAAGGPPGPDAAALGEVRESLAALRPLLGELWSSRQKSQGSRRNLVHFLLRRHGIKDTRDVVPVAEAKETRDAVPSGSVTLFELFVQALGKRSGTAGAAELQQFLDENRLEVAAAMSGFGPSGEFRNGEPLPASCFNDFYKWTMLPVVLAAERASGGVRCTFSVNIRDPGYRKQLYDSAVGATSPDLFEELKTQLHGLTKRIFDRALFEQCAEEHTLPHWGTDTIDAVCGPADAPRALVQEFKADVSCRTPVAPESPGAVLVQVFVAWDEKLKQDRIYIEATGPWHRVTWLETSMMQVVYDCLLRDRMRQQYSISRSSSGSWDDSAWFADWLAEAMCRCARSVKACQESGMKGALFTGRRTGGLALMMLQGMYVQQAFRSPNGASMLLGSSSVTSRYLSLAAGVAPEHVPKCAGTHAHELQMTLAAILGDLDDKCGLPLSQVVAHALYFYRSRPQGDVKDAARLSLMPMLTDTLGSRAFMRTAAKLRVPFGVHKGEPVLSIIGAARQDSGSLEAFRDIMSEFGFKGALMASEIETSTDVSKASSAGFKLFGAGGFMGDSEKAWDSTKTNISMAVKVLRVYVGGSGAASAFPPVKTGEVRTDGGLKEDKFEIDGTLPREKFEQSRQRTQLLCDAAPKVSDQELQMLFEGALRRFLPDELLASEAARSPGNAELELSLSGMGSSAASKAKVFWSGHLTSGFETKRQEWMAPHSEKDADIRASMPPFNNANKSAIPERVKCYNVPAYGPNISNAVMEIFTLAEVRSTAESMNVPIPCYGLSKFIQDKAVKVLDMVKYCQDTPDIAQNNADATQKLKNFVEEFQALGPSIKNVSDWETFVNRHAKPGWQAKMHFDHLLDNFGFEKGASDLLRRTEFEKADGEKVTFEQHAFRWLSKALGAYGPEGALTDVVNLAFVMTEQEFDGLTDIQIAHKIRAFKKKIETKDLSGLWIPNYFFMDAESDDCLAWILLQHVSQLQCTISDFKVLVQLPGDPEFDPLAREWSSKHNCEVWRDPDSRNAPALTRYHIEPRAAPAGSGTLTDASVGQAAHSLGNRPISAELELSLSGTGDTSASKTMGSLSMTPFATPPAGRAAPGANETKDAVPGGSATLFERFVQALGKRSGTAGAAEIQQFLDENRLEVAAAMSGFGPSGEFRNGEPLPASCFNDFYKWTMLPVVLAAERASGGVRCTFSVNIRDPGYRKQLYDSAVGATSPDLFEELKTQLHGLTKRIFDRALFEQCAEDHRLPHWGTDTIDAVCGLADAPRALVQEFKADASCRTPVAPESPGDVLVQVFVARDEKLKQDRIYIEATGPWHRVTWLETSMMQVVYDCLLRDRMRQQYSISRSSSGSWDDSAWFADWLAEAMCRCARSVKACQESGMKGALFTGRRTGGLALMMLQGMYVQQAFRSPNGASMLLGSSSVTSRYLSLAAGVAPEHVPKCAGTHAHELQMTLAAILGDLDDQCGLPLSHVVAHALYFYRSRPQGDVKDAARLSLMPMLTDTLGSRAFMRTAAMLRVPFGVHQGEPMLSVVGAARQDSGSLEAFRDIMAEFGFEGDLMASEIETSADVSKASSAGFKLFGAGGFMGDSEKAWDSTKTNISMAVKVLRVYVGGSGAASAFPPVKTGEVGTDDRIKEDKFEIDGTLPREKFEQSRQRTQLLCDAAPKVSIPELQMLFEGALRRFLPDEFLASEDLEGANKRASRKASKDLVSRAEELEDGQRSEFEGVELDQRGLLLKAIELDPMLGRAYADLACVLSAEGQGAMVQLGGRSYSEVDLHVRAIELDPSLQLAYENLSECLGTDDVVRINGEPMSKHALFLKAVQLRDGWTCTDNREDPQKTLGRPRPDTSTSVGNLLQGAHEESTDLWGAVADLKVTLPVLRERNDAQQEGLDAAGCRGAPPAADSSAAAAPGAAPTVGEGPLREGDRVELLSGRLAGQFGHVTDVDAPMQMVAVRLELSGKEVDSVRESDCRRAPRSEVGESEPGRG